MTTAVNKPALTAQAFLNLANQPPKIETIEVDGLGRVGILAMTIGQREAFHNNWNALKKQDDSQATFAASLLQATVCDDKADLILSSLTIEQINKLPVAVVEPLLERALEINGFKSKVDDARKN